eukprot:6190858-Pleurochrysis_carterae.AAC.2
MHDLLGDPSDPTALIHLTPFRWEKRFSHNNYTPLLAVATPLSPPLREPRYVPKQTVCLHGRGEGSPRGTGPRAIGVTAMDSSSPPLPHTRRANSIDTLEFMALVAAVATFHTFFCHFPGVVLKSDPLSATFQLADDRSKDNAAQRALE